MLVHGTPTESRRSAQPVLALLGVAVDGGDAAAAASQVASCRPASIGLQRLLEVRQVIGLRNSAHSLVNS